MQYTVQTRAEKWVMEYTGLSIIEVGELCYYDYLLLLRDAVIYTLSQSEKGREYLEECWLLEQKDPDRASMRKWTGKGKRR